MAATPSTTLPPSSSSIARRASRVCSQRRTRRHRSRAIIGAWSPQAEHGGHSVGDRDIGERAFIGLQYLLPQHLLSRLAGCFAESRIGIVRTTMIRVFMDRYAVDLSDAVRTEPAAY